MRRAPAKKLPQRWRADGLALASLVAVALAYFWRPLLSRGVWVPMGGGDLASFLYPMFAFAARSLARGELPLWNPHLHAGMPFAADLQSGLFYPLNWPVLLRGEALGYRDVEAVVLIHYPLAGALTYLFARDLAISRAGAWLSAVVFMFSGFLVTHLGHGNMVQSATWLPLELLCLRRAVQWAAFRWAVAAGATFALAFLAGHVQMVMLQALVFVAYALTFPARPGMSVARTVATRIGLLAVAGLVALGAAALKVLPGLELARASIRADLPFERATEFAAQPIGLATLLLPHLWGTNPTDYWGPWSNTEVLGYVGVLPLLLAVAALLVRADYHTRFFAALAALALLLSLGDATVLFGWVYRFVPGFDLVRAAGRYLYLFDFAVALLAARGLDALAQHAARPPCPSGDQVALAWLARLAGVLWLATVGIALPVLLAQQAASPNLLPRVITAISDLFFLALYLGASLLLLGMALLRRLSPPALVALALTVATIDVASAYHAFNPTTQDPTAGFRHPDLVARLKANAGLERIDSETGAVALWQPDSASVHGLYDAGGLFNPMQLARYAEFRRQSGRDYGSPAYDLLSVRFVIAPAAPPEGDAFRGEPASDFHLLERFPGGLALFEHLTPLPRARVVYAAETVDGLASALERLQQPGFDPARVALVEGPALPSSQPPPPTPAKVTRYSANAVDIAVEASAEGYLVLSDVYYPGWMAEVDGQPVPVVAAYGVFRAVKLQPGQHTVRFEFAPLSWQIGWRLSATTWVLLLAGVAWRLLWRRHVRAPNRGAGSRPNARSASAEAGGATYPPGLAPG